MNFQMLRKVMCRCWMLVLCVGLPLLSSERRALADGNEITAPPGEVRVRLGDDEQRITLTESECEALLKRFLEAQSELSELESSLTFTEGFNLVQQSINEAKEALKTTGGGAGETAEKITEKAEKIQNLLEKVRINNAQLRETVGKLSAGLERSGKAMTETAEVLDQVSGALDTLEIAVRARNMTAAGSLRAFAEYFKNVSGYLEPLLSTLPVIGTFINLYSQGIVQIADSVETIERETNRRNRLWRQLGESDRNLYLAPSTELELRQRTIQQKREELESIATQINAGCNSRVRFTDGQPQINSSDPMLREMDQVRTVARNRNPQLRDQVEQLEQAVGRAAIEWNAARATYDRLARTNSDWTQAEYNRLQASLNQVGETERRRRQTIMNRIQMHLSNLNTAHQNLQAKQANYTRLRQQAEAAQGQYLKSQRD